MIGSSNLDSADICGVSTLPARPSVPASNTEAANNVRLIAPVYTLLHILSGVTSRGSTHLSILLVLSDCN